MHAELITARGETATKSKVSDLFIANSLAIFTPQKNMIVNVTILRDWVRELSQITFAFRVG